MHSESEHGPLSPGMMRQHYLLFGANLLISLAIMYVAMFAMIWSWGDFVHNLNFLYMALAMWAPMAVVMLLTMKGMYRDARLNALLYAGLAVVFLLSLGAIRTQALVGDRQFLRSMIPHHSGAVLMCERAQVVDSEIKALCGRIRQSQTQEIDEMKVILRRL